MKLSLTALLALSALTIGAAACSSTDPDATLPPGQYKSSTNATTSNGTDVSKDTTTNVTVDANGNKTVSKSTTNTADPPGLFNKSKATTTTTKTY